MMFLVFVDLLVAAFTEALTVITGPYRLLAHKPGSIKGWRWLPAWAGIALALPVFMSFRIFFAIIDTTPFGIPFSDEILEWRQLIPMKFMCLFEESVQFRVALLFWGILIGFGLLQMAGGFFFKPRDGGRGHCWIGRGEPLLAGTLAIFMMRLYEGIQPGAYILLGCVVSIIQIRLVRFRRDYRSGRYAEIGSWITQAVGEQPVQQPIVQAVAGMPAIQINMPAQKGIFKDIRKGFVVWIVITFTTTAFGARHLIAGGLKYAAYVISGDIVEDAKDAIGNGVDKGRELADEARDKLGELKDVAARRVHDIGDRVHDAAGEAARKAKQGIANEVNKHKPWWMR